MKLVLSEIYTDCEVISQTNIDFIEPWLNGQQWNRHDYATMLFVTTTQVKAFDKKVLVFFATNKSLLKY